MKMSLAIPLLLASNLQLSAITFGQGVNFQKKNAKLETILKVLEEQSGYNILYKATLLSNAKRIDVDYKNVPFEYALKDVLANYQIVYKIMDNNVVLSKPASTAAGIPWNRNVPGLNNTLILQQRRVGGKVVDAKGNPISNVTITEKGTDNRTTTDDNGRFEIRLKSNNDQLVFSMLGYQSKEVNVNGQNEIQVSLNTVITAMDEVVVVGYGEQKKVNLTGAVS
ncbi:STN domain-containing protein [Sphingobacterium sp. UGAL515B_05]|uniref:STN domain-containing protein n=1 Tax=Sphingobacterium sp. UGAL515B_05 TaxID=2986767 RepID=UPI002954BBE3|nr:carboxypeptidase-like regulatory domain-containing protein [Sphingobacterium sp. UGAL515B_05]WON92516.1 carboxypeptidase-like regulatory domain-containing protein [Sphingobacterium sp. UGAL515B_05]